MSKLKPKIYLDTSVISAYYDVRQEERMKLTRESWRKIKEFEIFISEITLKELEDTTDLTKRKQFLKFTKGFNVLPVTPESKQLALFYTKAKLIPVRFQDDILQIATAVAYNMDYILSWNFRHMVNLTVKNTINAINAQNNYPLIEILAPAEML